MTDGVLVPVIRDAQGKSVWQLASEALPSDGKRNVILFYEAAEGGVKLIVVPSASTVEY